MKKLLFLFFAVSFFLLFQPAYARSGCCSWHGGVRADGCGCNDGSPLSSTCAPYYTCTAVQQDSAPVTSAPVYVAPTSTPTPYPTNTPTPTATPTPLPTATPTLMPTATTTATSAPTKPTTAVLSAKTNNNGDGWLLFPLAAGIIGGSIWWGRKAVEDDR